MHPSRSLHDQRDQILQQLGALGPMRKGSLTQQFFARTRRGRPSGQRGPYPLFTFKRKGRTVSRRIGPEQVETYSRQIEQFRRFEELIAQFVQVSQHLAELEGLDEPADQKKTSRR